MRPYVTLENRIEGASIAAVDIDALKKSLEQARLLAEEQAARADAELASRSKDEFLAMLGHELRNPLAPLSNALQVLKECILPDERSRRMLEIAERQVHHLSRMLNDLLDVSRVSRGKIELRKHPITLSKLIAEALESTDAAINAAGHTLRVVQPPDDVWVEADPVRLEQVLVNLLNNAIKYMPRGGKIEVTASRELDQAVISVRDNGYGIDPEVLPRIFDLFAQGARTPDRGLGGLGIGLTLARRLIDLHGGTIEARSPGVGQGSEFLVRLPVFAGPTEPSRRRPDTSPPTPARRVLIVDDSHDAAESLATMLQFRGHVVHLAENGESALEHARQQPPEIVLLDLGLPGIDGFETARRLRELPGMVTARIVAVTAYGQESDRERSRNSGCDEHLTKPVDEAALMKVLEAGAKPAHP
jgi:signal transduction histidine kinase/ActR/RegA family two-component response regulator